ncbi:hypothetical protein E2C01_073296 [Portunus trituberculatus]|uniref:Uncharacterized protein n=1 Tax=Portunus trituberculatus TaxID=210409 RepID=A0A5B7ICY7_PORTR|nr:hypothetical protein [Portunus trituberculatus]
MMCTYSKPQPSSASSSSSYSSLTSSSFSSRRDSHLTLNIDETHTSRASPAAPPPLFTVKHRKRRSKNQSPFVAQETDAYCSGPGAINPPPTTSRIESQRRPRNPSPRADLQEGLVNVTAAAVTVTLKGLRGQSPFFFFF